MFWFTLDKSITNLLKLSYHAPRPYFVTLNYDPLNCSKEFGSPSGHSFSALLISIGLILDQFYGENVDKISKEDISQKSRKMSESQNYLD